jgi:nucleotide-binding universal stress UspA family protein
MSTAQVTPIGVSIHNVLIATDFSRYSKAALEAGLRLATRSKAESYILFVVPNDQFLLAGPAAYVAAKDAGRRDLESLQLELERAHSGGEARSFHFFLLEGEVSQSILDFARQRKCDLIVLGTHGRGGLGRAILGSVAEHVFRNSPVPVLTIGPYCCRAEKALDPANILVPIAFSPASERAAQYGAALASEHKAKLTLLHVLDPKDSADREKAAVKAKRKLEGVLGQEFSASCNVRIEFGRVVPMIMSVADEIAADLLVMGVRASAGVLDHFRWPNVYEAVRQASCPVLTVREAGNEGSQY